MDRYSISTQDTRRPREPVLPTDWSAPPTAALKRISDPRAVQFWDEGRLLSRAMGEYDKDSMVWDRIPPKPLWDGGPVLAVIGPARAALTQALATPKP